ncbi:MAG: chromate efflux transporter [Hyphomicrobiales bacterium]
MTKITQTELVPFAVAFKVWTKIGLLSFGGPAGQIATMHRLLVEEKGWLSEERYLRALNFCMLLPGPEAQQLATYAGWMTHGIRGGVAAGLMFVLPGALVMLLLSFLYAKFGTLPVVEGIFFGIKAAVLAIVAQALLKVGRRALKGQISLAIAMVAFLSLAVFQIPFPIVVLSAGVLGAVFLSDSSSPPERNASPQNASMLPALISAAMWALPIALALILLGSDNTVSQLGLFFSKIAVVTFGGAYAVLSYVGQQAVELYGWMAPGAMLDGLGLAETTPGPLVLVNVFVGFQAGFATGAPFSPSVGGVLGALMTLWVTFAPSFLWIFAGAPYLDRIQANPKLSGALSAITAAVVGVIANLAFWFALQVLFREQIRINIAWMELDLPQWSSVNGAALVLTALAFVGVFKLKIGLFALIFSAACGGLLWQTLL